MQLNIAFFFFVFAFVGAEACGDSKLQECSAKIMSRAVEERNVEEDCASLNEALSCLREAEAECTGGETNPKIEEGKAFLSLMGAANCEQEEPSDETKECLSQLEPGIDKCVEEAVEHALGLLPEDGELELPDFDDEIKCQMYERIIGCGLALVEDSCGEEAAMSVFSDVMKSEQAQECKGTIFLGLFKKR